MKIPVPPLPVNLITDAPTQVVMDERVLVAMEAIRHELSAMFWLVLILGLLGAFGTTVNK